VTSGYELAVPQAFMNTSPFQYPICLRGQAYLKAGQGQQAAAMFQKLTLSLPTGGSGTPSTRASLSVTG